MRCTKVLHPKAQVIHDGYWLPAWTYKSPINRHGSQLQLKLKLKITITIELHRCLETVLVHKNVCKIRISMTVETRYGSVYRDEITAFAILLWLIDISTQQNAHMTSCLYHCQLFRVILRADRAPQCTITLFQWYMLLRLEKVFVSFVFLWTLSCHSSMLEVSFCEISN
jgi:hypothetical protein